MRLKIKDTFQKASGFFQTKKILSKKFLLIFFVVAIVATAGVSVPAHSANAGLGIDTWLAGKIINFSGSVGSFVDTFQDEGGYNTIIRLLYAVVVAVLGLALKLVAYLAYFGAWLIDIMLSPGLAQGVLESDAIDTGWKTVRDACNTFFIFFMLLIAFSTILRIQKYGTTKSLLSKFIISIFLINFSMVIAKIIIDVGQVFMYEIKAWMGVGFGDYGGSLTSIVEKFKNETTTGWQASFEDIIRALFAVIYTVMLGLIFIMLAGFLLIRLVMFAILIVLSPFAFLSIVLPSMSKYTSEWFDTLIKYSIFGPVFLFFIYLSATMANELVLVDYTDALTGVPAASADMSAISGIVGVMVSHLVAICMLWAAIPVTQRLGVAGSQQLIGGAAGIGKIAIGTYGGIKLAGGLGKKAGGAVEKRSSVVRSATSSMGKLRDSGLKAVGAKRTVLKNTARKEKAKEEHMKKVEMDFGDLKSIDLKLLEEKAGKRVDGTTDDKALWLKAAAAQGKLGENEKTAKKFMAGAENSMSDKEMKEVTDKSLTLAMGTEEVKNRIKNDGEENNKSFSKEAQTRIGRASSGSEKKRVRKEEVEKEKINDLIEKGETHKLQDLGSKDTARIYDENVSSDQKKSDKNRMSKKQRGELAEGYIGNAKDAIQTGDKERELKFKTNAVELDAGLDLQKTFEAGGRTLSEAADDIDKVFHKFDAKTVAKFDDGVLDKHGYKATNSQTKAMNRAGGNDDQLKTIRQSKVNRIGTLASAGDGKNYNDTKEKLKKLQKEKDPDKSKVDKFEREIKILEDTSNDVKDMIDLEKDRDSIDGSLSGKTY